MTSAPGHDLGLDRCADGVRDGDETDVGCGGPSCPPCRPGRRCNDGHDCESAICQEATCRSSSHCSDGVRDDAETDVDCGGPRCPYCRAGQACGADADCAAGTVCSAGTCSWPRPLRLAWKPAATYDTGPSPGSIAAGDLADLVTNGVDVFRGGPGLTFADPEPHDLGGAGPVALADLDRDGHVDLVLARLDGTLMVALGAAGATFLAPTTIGIVDGGVGGLVVTDLDSDGRPDLACTGFGASTVTVILNDAR